MRSPINNSTTADVDTDIHTAKKETIDPFCTTEGLSWHQMFRQEALRLLGLNAGDAFDEQAIRTAWKRRLKEIHPDKNLAAGATAYAQQINEAKDTLCSFFVDVDQKMKDNEDDERKAREKEQEEHRRQMDELQRRVQKQQYEKRMKNRKKRAEGSRIHRRAEQCEEGTALLQEMEAFFRKRFHYLPCTGRHVFVSQIRDIFIFSRLGITDLEKHLFKRHAKRIILSIWPEVQYRQYRGKYYVRYLFFNAK